jgi:glutathione peroxidase
VLGFPCNQFGGQEPGTPEEIREFVTSKYDIDFPMFAKIEVNGDDQADLYTQLKDQQPGDDESADIKWNFEKFLVGPDGNAIARWGTGTTPEEIAAELPDLMV